MFRFTIRELVLAIALVAIVVAWFVDRLTLNEALESAKARAMVVHPLQDDH
jgi:hypothetical protein